MPEAATQVVFGLDRQGVSMEGAFTALSRTSSKCHFNSPRLNVGNAGIGIWICSL